MSTILIIIILILLLIGGIPTGPWWGTAGSQYGWGPSGIIGIILIVVIVLALLGRL